MRTSSLFALTLVVLAPVAVGYAADHLPGTQPLTATGDLAKQMVDGIHKYLDRELEAAPKKRDEWAKQHPNEPTAAKRDRLRKILGMIDTPEPRKVEFYGRGTSSTLVAPAPNSINVSRIRWDVLPNLQAEGLYIQGAGDRLKATATVIVIPHAGQTPDDLAMTGLDKVTQQFVVLLATNGCNVYIPDVLDRTDKHSGNARLNRFTNFPHREYLHRMAYEMGRTVTGLQVQQVLSILPKEKQDAPIGVIGMGDGGRIAMFAAALDDRIDVCQISGAFGPQEQLWKQPIDRNAWGILKEFGDAEVAALIAPRKLIIDPGATVKWAGPNPPANGRAGAAPGTLEPITEADLQREMARIPPEARKSVTVVRKPGEQVATDDFLMSFGVKDPKSEIRKKDVWERANGAERTEVTQKRLLERNVAFIQNQWRLSEPVRKEFWKKADTSSLAKWEQSTEWYRNHFHEEAMGKLPEPTMPLNPRSRQIYDTPKWTGYEITLDVYDDVFAAGILLLPKDMKPGEKRPVVVCQHGLEGRPTDVCNPKEKTKYYNSFGAALADRGYIVFAPQNPYIFDTYFRQILRKGNPIKLSLFSFIIRQHQRIIDWLETQPNVDPKRIAFYGLSYGGKTAMRVPAVEKRYCLSICAGDFNEWVGKTVSQELPMSYMFTREYDMLEFNLGNTYNYAEMANLIAPRPFMVERGHDDGVGIDEMIAYEYAKVRYLYANKLKIADRTTIEFQPGGHEIFLRGTLAFLEKHIGKP